MPLPALENNFFVQFRAAVGVPFCLPVTGLPVGNVFPLGTAFQMLRIHATGVVAGVSDDGRKGTVFDVVCYAMSQFLPTIDGEDTVSVRVGLCLPFVALARAVDLFTEALVIGAGEVHLRFPSRMSSNTHIHDVHHLGTGPFLLAGPDWLSTLPGLVPNPKRVGNAPE